MGKIKIKFDTLRMGVDFKSISEVVNCIPGLTTIESFEEINQSTNSLIREFVLEVENMNFADDTEIVPKYRAITVTTNGLVKTVLLFDGITIIDPPAAHQHNLPHKLTTGNGTYTIPASSTIVSYKMVGGGGGGGSSGIHTNGTVTKAIDKWSQIYINPNLILDKRCTCGAGAVKGIHSTWCDIKD